MMDDPSADEASNEGPQVHAFDASDLPEEAPAEPTLEEQLETEKDRGLRLQAEIQNVLSRKSREVAEERKYGGISLMRDLLPVLDNIERAIGAAEKAEEESSAGLEESSAGLIEGFRLVRQQLITLLGQHQCEPIAAEGAPFDPDLHEAILQQPSTDHAAGQVVMVVQLGYKLHDRVVRPAQVIVSSGPATE